MSDLPTVEILKWEGSDHHTIRWQEGQGVPGMYRLVRVDAIEEVWWCDKHRATGLGGAMPGGVAVANLSPWCWWADETQVPSVARECEMSWRWLVKGADDAVD